MKRAGSPARPVPWNDDAERVAIGSCLVSADALHSVLRIVGEQDFYSPECAEAFAAIRSLVARNEPVNKLVLAEELERRGRLDVLPKPLVIDFLGCVGGSHEGEQAARIVKDLSRQRCVIRAATVLGAGGPARYSSAEVNRATRELLELVGDPDPSRQASAVEANAFLAQQDSSSFDWVIPGFLERQDRVLVVGREGVGKSLLLQQIAVQVASGVHPFHDKGLTPARVLIVDLENSAREMRRRLLSLRESAGEQWGRGALFVISRPEGLDLADCAEDRAWLSNEVRVTGPDVIVVGPLYKAASGNPNDEVDAKPVALFLDTLRTQFGCALIVESHMPHGDSRPVGWSGWRRWPEIGVELTAKGEIKPWRPSRHETPALPRLVQRGGRWPFTAANRSRDLLWARIAEHAQEVRAKPSIRELASELDVNRNAVDRALREHAEEWKAMFP